LLGDRQEEQQACKNLTKVSKGSLEGLWGPCLTWRDRWKTSVEASLTKTDSSYSNSVIFTARYILKLCNFLVQVLSS